MIEFIKWWVLFVFIGWVTFPLAFSVFRNLPSRGYGISKTFALLIWGYIYWLGNSFAIISNTALGAGIVLGIIFISSLRTIRKNWEGIRAWIKNNAAFILFSEILFIISAMFMLVMRSANPEIIGTEKPMELMFLNGIGQSQLFPPHDPWLSGYSISYYYFGYLIINLIVKVLSTPTGIAFNLSLIFWFSLIAVGAADILTNLLFQDGEAGNNDSGRIPYSTFLLSLIAPFFLLIVSNAEGFLELLHSLGVFWRSEAAGNLTSSFWSWIDIKELTNSPPMPLDWNLQRPGGTWWWRASRVLQDYTLQGQPREIIDEFPFFSFFLGDLHPHVLAIPFVLLCISSGFEAYKRDWVTTAFDLSKLPDLLMKKENWLFGFIFGSLIFLNTWDFPIYFGLFALCVVIRMNLARENLLEAIKASILHVFIIGVVAIMLYLPFLMSFSSQAGGVLPSLIFQSRSIHQVVMFFPLLIPTFLFIFNVVFNRTNIKKLPQYIFASSSLFLFGLMLSFFFVAAAARLQGPQFGSLLGIFGANDASGLILSAIQRIMADPWMKIILLITISAAILIALSKTSEERGQSQETGNSRFVGLIIFMACVLIVFPEIFYLHDQFGWRMNTIFKFYFQAWLLLSISAAFGIGYFLRNAKGVKRIVIMGLITFGIFPGLVYPAYAFSEKLLGFSFARIELDGTAYYRSSNPEEMRAIEFLKDNGCGIVAEAVGGSYTNYGRISKISGCATVIGWPGHELQWRGSSEPIGSRESDIQKLYTTSDWLTASEIIKQYGIDYVLIGNLERSTYPVIEDKFMINLVEIFREGPVVIYGGEHNG